MAMEQYTVPVTSVLSCEDLNAGMGFILKCPKVNVVMECELCYNDDFFVL